MSEAQIKYNAAMSPRHLLLLLIICLIWAGNFIAAAWAVSSMPPVMFTVVRFVMVLALVIPFLRPPTRGQWPLLLAVCWCMGALHFVLVFLALGKSADVSSVAILMQVYVPLTTLLAVLVLGESIGWRTVAGVALAFAGVLLVGLDPLVLAQLDVLLLVLVSAFFLALGTVMMRRLNGLSVFSFQGWNALLSLPLLFAASLWLDGTAAWGMLDQVPASAWAAVAFSAVGASIIGHGSFYWLIQRYPVTEITPYLLLVPVLAVLLGVLVWGDRPGWRLIVGGAVVLAGVFWVTWRAKARSRKVVDEESCTPAA